MRREGLHSTDLARIQHKVKERALKKLAKRPGRSKKSVAGTKYEALKQELKIKTFVGTSPNTSRPRFGQHCFFLPQLDIIQQHDSHFETSLSFV